MNKLKERKLKNVYTEILAIAIINFIIKDWN